MTDVLVQDWTDIVIDAEWVGKGRTYVLQIGYPGQEPLAIKTSKKSRIRIVPKKLGLAPGNYMYSVKVTSSEHNRYYCVAGSIEIKEPLTL